MDFMLTSTFVIILVAVISLPTLAIMSFLWWCIHRSRLKIEKKIDAHHDETFKIMMDFQDMQKEFLTITKIVNEFNKRLERLEKKR